MKLGIVMLALVTFAVAGCDINKWDPPLPVTPAPGEPCGVTGHVCVETGDAGPTSLVATGFCCDQVEVCGDAPGAVASLASPNVGCPPGECCFEAIGGVHGAEHHMVVAHHQRRAR